MADPAPVLVLLGGAGDLSMRMLLPALLHLEMDSLLPKDLRIIAVGRADGDADSYRADVHRPLSARDEFDDSAWERLARRLDYVKADAATEAGAKRLKARIGKAGQLIVYFALSPNLFAGVTEALSAAGLIGERTRLVLEKPIGRDLETSVEINAVLAKAASERQVFRIDHYLGKETVQNLIALRFANALFEPLWNNQAIDHVQITVAETQAVGIRTDYYNDYGAMRDMLQNHMLQLLCLVAMEPPSALQADAVRDEKVKVLRSLRPFTAEAARTDSVRGQYVAGIVDGAKAGSYESEVGRPSPTETFVALIARIDNWRWSGVPFYLRTGKRMAKRRTKIVIQFKPISHSIFGPVGDRDLQANRLVIDLQPDEDISLTIMNKRPGLNGEHMRLKPLSLSLAKSQSGEGGERRIAYERLLLDVLRGDPTLFVRDDEVEAAWKFVDGVADAWVEAGVESQTYPAGSWGPDDASDLMKDGGRAWDD